MTKDEISTMIKIEQLRLFRDAMETTYRDVSELFDNCNVWSFIDDMYEFMHIQGDEVSFNEIGEYLKRQGISVA
ncbi:MAG: DUF3791 domain-containing protein [Prevotella sp.]|jgi:hypothetical protein|nr:DUF3791 domain-containing protein [Prevotella sp.]